VVHYLLNKRYRRALEQKFRKSAQFEALK